MALTARSLILVAVPTFLAAVLGYFWFGKKKKVPAIKPASDSVADMASDKETLEKQDKTSCQSNVSNAGENTEVSTTEESSPVLPNQEDTIDALVGAKSKDKELTLGSCSSLEESISGVSLSGSAESMIEVEPIQEETIQQEHVSQSCNAPVLSDTIMSDMHMSSVTEVEATEKIVSHINDKIQQLNIAAEEKTVSGCSTKCVESNSDITTADNAIYSNSVEDVKAGHQCTEALVHGLCQGQSVERIEENYQSQDSFQSQVALDTGDVSTEQRDMPQQSLAGQGDCNSNHMEECEPKHTDTADTNRGQPNQRTVAESPTEKLMNSSVGSSGSSNSDGGHSEVSEDSGKGTSVLDGAVSPQEAAVCDSVIIYEFDFPRKLAGRLIGQYGRNINNIRDKTGVEIILKRKSYNKFMQSCILEGTSSQVETALKMMQKRFPDVDMSQTNVGPVLPPEMMQLSLPEGVNVDVLVSSVVAANHLFVQQPTHPTFMSLERMNQFMMTCYNQDAIVPQLPRPIEEGVICAAPMYSGWYRAQVVASYEDTDECDVKFVDYGGYMKVQGCILRQIRSDFTSLPFQAVECYLANVIPPKDGVGFPQEANAVLEELVHRKLLQAQIVAFEQDGVPYIQLYSVSGDEQVFINRELVDRGLARWMEVSF